MERVLVLAFFQLSLSNNRMGGESLKNETSLGRVQGVELMEWANTRPLVCGTPSARSKDAREARY